MRRGAAAPASPSVEDLQAQASSVHREAARLDHRAEVLTEKYNVARAALDAINISLQEARRNLERASAELDAAQAQRGDRLAAMYKSDGYSMLDVIFNLSDIGDASTQLGYFRSIDEADQDTVARVAAMEQHIQALTKQIDDDRAEALDKEMALREQQAAIEDELAAREQLLTDLDARVKKLLSQLARLDAAASARLAKAAGVDLASIHGTPAQIAVIKETMKYLGIPYVGPGRRPRADSTARASCSTCTPSSVSSSRTAPRCRHTWAIPSRSHGAAGGPGVLRYAGLLPPRGHLHRQRTVHRGAAHRRRGQGESPGGPGLHAHLPVRRQPALKVTAATARALSPSVTTR